MRYMIRGNLTGELLVFINGAGVGPWMWKEQYVAFGVYKCLFFDLPGHGENCDIDFISIEEAAKLISELIKKEGLDGKAHLVGLSIGAQIALYMLQHYGQSLRSVTAVSALNKPMKFLVPWIKPTVKSTMPLIKYKWFAKMNAKSLALPSELFESYYADSLRISERTLCNIMASNLTFELSGVERATPVLLLAGEKEKGIMIESLKRTKAALQAENAFVLGCAGHGIPYENPKAFNEMLHRFLKGAEVLEADMREFKTIDS